ncbi:serine protease [Deinococcus taeanensis]|uniref:S1 family peptidase n=1 Tax=Deinococcus taeanensis TaxID=2737050 RepID=UPI001CDD4D58|nr:serine protease [Deinococcus taeanensis]UBV42575.1 serine protease [Deinococcus taeanensis]
MGGLLLLLWSWAGAQSLPKDVRERIIQATVMLLPTDRNGELDGSLGSGSIISPQGYILTNYHVVGDPDTRQLSPWIQVRVVRFVDREPEFTYWGKVVAADPNLDLAVVKITEDRNEKPVGTLKLPFVELGDSNSLGIGDDVFVFGFQGTGGMTLSFSRGSVGGFTGEDLNSSGRQWVKHDAQTGPGNSGGGAYDENGALVGVHSAGVAGEHNSRTSFMRPLAVAWGLITPNVTGFVLKKGAVNAGRTDSPRSTPAPGWPPALTTARGGVTGTVRVTGNAASGTWSTDFTELDKDGNLKGTARNGSQNQTAYFYYDDDNDEVWVEWTADGKAYASCIITPGAASSSDWKGTFYTFPTLDAKGTRTGECVVSLKARTAAPAPPASTTSGTWPPALAGGQAWTATFAQGGTYAIRLAAKDSEGDYPGTATQGSAKSDALVTFDPDTSKLLFIVSRADKTLLTCSAERSGQSGGTLRGTARAYRDAKDTGAAAGTCTLSLGAAPTPSAPVLTWPVRLGLGQRWDVTFPGVGTFALSVDERDDKGGFDGAATRGSEKGSVLLDDAGGELLVIVQRADKTFLVCSVQQGPSGGSLRGAATSHRDSQDKGVSLGSCTVTPR